MSRAFLFLLSFRPYYCQKGLTQLLNNIASCHYLLYVRIWIQFMTSHFQVGSPQQMGVEEAAQSKFLGLARL